MDVFVFTLIMLAVMTRLKSTCGEGSVVEFYNEQLVGKLVRETPDGAMGSLLKSPELTIEPSVEGEDKHIIFRRHIVGSYKKFISQLDSVFEAYKSYNMHDGNIIDCASYSGYRPPEQWDKVCRFDPENELIGDGRFSDACLSNKDYGFDDGVPCIVLGLDRVLDWLPEPYTNETVPDEIRHVWKEGYIPVTCKGDDPFSVDSTDEIKTIPENGFHIKYFPYVGQSAWKTPLVQVIVISDPAIAVTIRCKAWAKNIVHNDLLSTGSVRFTLLVD